MEGGQIMVPAMVCVLVLPLCWVHGQQMIVMVAAVVLRRYGAKVAYVDS